MNYFDFYELPLSFTPDKKTVKEKFLTYSKKYHPDFHTLASPEKQHEILRMSTLNTKAFETLSDPDKCMKYILQEKGLLQEEKYALPQIFLMEMLNLNELVMELQFDPSVKVDVETHLSDALQRQQKAIEPILNSFTEQTATHETYAAVKEYYYKRKYLLRIQEQLHKFANP